MILTNADPQITPSAPMPLAFVMCSFLEMPKPSKAGVGLKAFKVLIIALRIIL